MRLFRIAALGAGLLPAILLSSYASGHGWTDYPKARQTICAEDGGYWSPADGSGIPNDACRAAYLESGTYPFTQKNEFAANVDDFHNMDAVKAVVTNNLLCAAGAPSKSGMDTPSAHWQKTRVKAGEPLQLSFRATAPHNPSFWEIYLSKPEFNSATQKLHWNDLDLIATHGNLPVLPGDYYEMPVTLPAGRTGDAILYVRWQRDDSGGEGFYNCSDITFSDTTTPPGPGPDPKPDLVNIGSYISAAHTGTEAGDRVRFRLFSPQGMDVIDEQLVLTESNASVGSWTEQLALMVNDKHKDKVFIGIWHDAMNHLMYDKQNVYANRIWAPSDGYNYSTSIIKSNDPKPPVCVPKDPAAANLPLWSSASTYVAGNRVNYLNLVWEAKWWITGEQPDTSSAWKLISDATLPWQSGKAYVQNDQVVFGGRIYQARQWVNDSPSTSPELWIDQGEYECK